MYFNTGRKKPVVAYHYSHTTLKTQTVITCLAVAIYLNERYYGFDPASGTGSLRTLAPVSPLRLPTAACRRTT